MTTIMMMKMRDDDIDEPLKPKRWTCKDAKSRFHVFKQ